MENPQRQQTVMNWICIFLWADIPMTSPRILGDLYFLKPSNVTNRANNGTGKEKKKSISVIFATFPKWFILKLRKKNKAQQKNKQGIWQDYSQKVKYH